MTNAYRRAGVLRYAALQLVVLVAIAMVAYPGGTWLDPEASRYELTTNFLSDLGRTHTFDGTANYLSAALFAVALITIGGALVAFALAWRALATPRAGLAGPASAVFGSACGAAFAGIALVPVDLALPVHNGLTIAAFGLSFVYVACLTVVMVRRELGRLAINLAYLVVLAGYLALVVVAQRWQLAHTYYVMVVGQKIIVGLSMLHIVYVTTVVRRGVKVG